MNLVTTNSAAEVRNDPLGLLPLEEALIWRSTGPLPDWLEEVENESDAPDGSEFAPVGQGDASQSDGTISATNPVIELPPPPPAFVPPTAAEIAARLAVLTDEPFEAASQSPAVAPAPAPVAPSTPQKAEAHEPYVDMAMSQPLVPMDALANDMEASFSADQPSVDMAMSQPLVPTDAIASEMEASFSADQPSVDMAMSQPLVPMDALANDMEASFSADQPSVDMAMSQPLVPMDALTNEAEAAFSADQPSVDMAMSQPLVPMDALTSEVEASFSADQPSVEMAMSQPLVPMDALANEAEASFSADQPSVDMAMSQLLAPIVGSPSAVETPPSPMAESPVADPHIDTVASESLVPELLLAEAVQAEPIESNVVAASGSPAPPEIVEGLVDFDPPAAPDAEKDNSITIRSTVAEPEIIVEAPVVIEAPVVAETPVVAEPQVVVPPAAEPMTPSSSTIESAAPPSAATIDWSKARACVVIEAAGQRWTVPLAALLAGGAGSEPATDAKCWLELEVDGNRLVVSPTTALRRLS
jgi:hypothetical protein